MVQPILFWVLAAVVLVAAMLVVRLGNVFHAGLCLIATFGGVAGLYVLLSAHFLAAVQVLIYVGAIAVILMFAVMLTSHIMARETEASLGRQAAALVVSGLFAILGVLVVNAEPWKTTSQFTYVSVGEIGRLFLDKSKFLLPFELVAVLLLVALVGAVMVAWNEGGEE